MRWMCALWLAALLLGMGIVGLMNATGNAEAEPAAMVEEEQHSKEMPPE